VCEERLTPTKNGVGYPRRSIDEVLHIVGCEPSDVDVVVYASNFMHSADHLSRATDWYRAGLADQLRDSTRTGTYLRAVFETRREERITQVVEQVGCAREAVR